MAISSSESRANCHEDTAAHIRARFVIQSPTLAHLGLANSLPPDTAIHSDSDYSAKLLLLSVKNADKTLKPGDARYEQRLEMMHLLAKSMQPLRTAETAQLTTEEAANAAIAIIDEPTFVGKSRVLRQALVRILAGTPAPAPVVAIADIELTFLIGHDTLARLVSPRYYPSETAMLASLRTFMSADAAGGDRSRVVSAQRSAPAGSDGVCGDSGGAAVRARVPRRRTRSSDRHGRCVAHVQLDDRAPRGREHGAGRRRGGIVAPACYGGYCTICRG